MDKTVLIPSVILAIFLIGVYLYRCWQAGIEASNSVVVSSLLNSSGIVCGLALAASPFFPAVKAMIGGIDIYIVIGGVAVLFVSSQGIHKEVIKSTRSESVNKPVQQTAEASVD
ncbi:hypothetical protein [Marinobacter sediminum]|uniref:hypothetical protein n=1 Tax=Marinobacter sediminum TaxID=256323 RepID=UPI0019393D0A|nr:hypothetical protein [Marinobacter sediminum]